MERSQKRISYQEEKTSVDVHATRLAIFFKHLLALVKAISLQEVVKYAARKAPFLTISQEYFIV